MEEPSLLNHLEGVELGDVANWIALGQALYFVARALPGVGRVLRERLEQSSSHHLYQSAIDLVQDKLGPNEADRLIERLSVLHPLLKPVSEKYAPIWRERGSLPYGDFLGDLVPGIGGQLGALGCFRKATLWRDARLLPLPETTRSLQRSGLLRDLIKGDILQKGQVLLKKHYGDRQWSIHFAAWPLPASRLPADVLFGTGTSSRIWIPADLRRVKGRASEARWYTVEMDFNGFWKILLGLTTDLYTQTRDRKKLDESRSQLLAFLDADKKRGGRPGPRGDTAV